SGLWIRALLWDYRFPPEEPERLAWRRRVEGFAERWGWERVRRLALLADPGAAGIHPADHRRLSRVLEVFWGTGEVPARSRGEARYRVVFWVLTRPRAELRRRIAERAAAQLAAGLQAETAALLTAGVPPRAQSLTALGYRECVDWLYGRLADAELLPVLIRHTARYAKRQLTWFRAEPDARWLDLSRLDPEEAVARIAASVHPAPGFRA
ncbi:MAG: tRNA (adenosine(37)-N6)-dimethylallyltransferase MiaA, partial [Firmicutes bacterium]|nr:tRNA (adenosine(37)-N6)-dimethylallyltransferase MiaA [Bacillota bacterium]